MLWEKKIRVKELNERYEIHYIRKNTTYGNVSLFIVKGIEMLIYWIGLKIDKLV